VLSCKDSATSVGRVDSAIRGLWLQTGPSRGLDFFPPGW
jgi:hypothetical protein